jgi:hypothetical protein
MCYDLTEKLLKSNEGKIETKDELELAFTAEKAKKAPVDIKEIKHLTGSVSINIKKKKKIHLNTELVNTCNIISTYIDEAEPIYNK